MAMLLAVVLVTGFLPDPVNAAESISELQSQVDKLKEEQSEIEDTIKELEGKLSDNLDKMQDIVDQKNTIDQEIFLLHSQIANLNEQITTYSRLIADKQEELDEAEARLEELNQKNKERIRAMEEDGSMTYWSVLFKANDFADLLDRLNMMEEIASADQRRLKEMSEAAKVVAEAKESLETEKTALEESKKTLEDSQETLEEKRAEADKLLAKLVASGEEYQALLDDAEDQSNDVSSRLEDAESDLKDAKHEQWLSTSVPATTAPSSTTIGGATAGSSNVVSGKTWLVPCSYVLFSSPFGYRTHPVYGDTRFHCGVDLAGPMGTPIVATRSGTVYRAAYRWAEGYYVMIDHGDGFVSEYFHMTHYIVSAGQQVTAGQVIGYMGSTGTSTGSHLHFGVLYNGTYVNPANYINI